MQTTLFQKHIFKGTQKFEIIDDTVHVHLKAPFRQEESLTVMLTILNPEPLINKSLLEFTSRVNNEPLLSLYLAKPNPEEFNQFVSLLKQRIQDEYNAFAGIKSGNPSPLEHNVFEEPPEFDDPVPQKPARQKPIRVEDLEDSIRMLSEYIGSEEIQPLITALKDLQAEPDKDIHLSKVINEFNALGAGQGAVLTYAPYIGILMSDGAVSGY